MIQGFSSKSVWAQISNKPKRIRAFCVKFILTCRLWDKVPILTGLWLALEWPSLMGLGSLCPGWMLAFLCSMTLLPDGSTVPAVQHPLVSTCQLTSMGFLLSLQSDCRQRTTGCLPGCQPQWQGHAGSHGGGSPTVRRCRFVQFCNFFTCTFLKNYMVQVLAKIERPSY